MRLNIKIHFLILISFIFCKAVFAEDVATELAKKAQNPVENMISVPFNNSFNFGYGPNNNTQYELDLKPVIPFALNSSFNIITRTIIPILHQPDLNTPHNGYINGMGDINPTLFLSPAKPGRIIWGIGPSIILPTATDKQLGQGKYSLGPSIVILSMPGHWVLGFLTSNVWSVGGQSSRLNVNQLLFQYFINYNISEGWYITSQPIITANWMAKSNECWTIPFGLGGGRVFHISRQAINISLQAYDNIKSPKTLGPDWQAQLNVTLLFPD